MLCVVVLSQAQLIARYLDNWFVGGLEATATQGPTGAGVGVFLGGSCNPTTWRKDIAIPLLDAAGSSYYNPQVGYSHLTAFCVRVGLPLSRCIEAARILNESHLLVSLLLLPHLQQSRCAGGCCLPAAAGVVASSLYLGCC